MYLNGSICGSEPCYNYPLLQVLPLFSFVSIFSRERRPGLIAPASKLITVAPNSSKPITYADAGVNIDQANRTKQRIKYLAHKTFTKGVLSEIGGFGGLFAIDKTKYLDPILVSSVDGVGTKLKLAFEMKVHHTIGADL